MNHSVNSKAEEQKDNDTYAKNFTRVPNILFESYRYITKEEVLLYIRLRYIYWDTKPRFLSLRELADITAYSTGALSKMLPRLTAVGLIHAEIRKKKGKDGREKGNPVYHITINDIWEENRKFFTEGVFDPSEVLLVHQMNETRSPNEQDIPQPVHQMNKPVHQMNKPVHQVNDLVHQMRQGCSPNEQDQAQNEAHKITYKTSNKTSLQDKYVTDDSSNSPFGASAPTPSEEEYWNLPIPVTYADAIAYLKPHGPHEGLDAVQVISLARKLWVEAHPLAVEVFDPDETAKQKVVKPIHTTLPSKPLTTPTPAQDIPPVHCETVPGQVASGDTPSQLSTSYPQGASNGQLDTSKGEYTHELMENSMVAGSRVPDISSELRTGIRDDHAVAAPSQAVVPQARGKNRPKPPKDEILAARTEAVFVCMENMVGRLAKDESFCFTRSGVATKCVRDLLNGHTNGHRVTQESVELVIETAWNTPRDEKSGFCWQDNMTVKAMCNNYDRLLLIAHNKTHKASGNSILTNGTLPSISGRPQVGQLPPEWIAATGGLA